ncbi:MAG: M23 family metallopeptidase [Elainella sp. C42_A2020_010]|nr:M23 family metallopeptidase [Elainella sp. C42_A2020_010]RNJ69496.1 MAG: M23 family metallopeptidase [Leptolyngbya sp. IPPAS B-1204]
MTRYAHAQRLFVTEGREIKQGEVIGEVGPTGFSTGPHLHFEIHFPQTGMVDPLAYLAQNLNL